ncbi:alpha/beta hydrolase [Sulfitobacter pseudonitzschiae]|uniref:Alpha/beta hydrolase n=1 Tax=Pseudosulfitobacter pseudonitzschiae TaxID=1402135 RepID=A0A9Q2P0K8_9RHOB|nr:alpha/beta hydrolase [Pseudosulfitobacter pseudonitzschiae]MBM2291723.1 alpha/beta hydrolase [Pseudosulfitobacter pseudonitzschiae]MBM2296641.1 alpha/beta hydrolase [Pseudosulfitobacter pseudonitzschiae]MBM2301554.1 alpha/beta hydrolase [Pseudosulfitobacter pseudonitzschiae]MBM2311338.1 alpha/beta hydrolase [Pseudosulfitobacter pseudonitzschiae]MBM2316251.1 alpha/beta hydrolase [Pseudosulfitobacter pseudonitzschiae]
MHRHSLEHDGIILSFLDAGGDGKPLIALHGHWMGASDFSVLAEDLAPDWRVIALDQRGFGETDHAVPHSMTAYVSDVIALLDHLSITEQVPVLGHSFGGIVAYHLAAAHPDRISAMVIEDIGVNIQDDSTPYVADWGGTFRLREDLEERLGPRLAPYLQNSIHRVAEGWALNFDPTEFLVSEQATNGDHWTIWLQSQCPALVVSGSESRICDAAELRSMAEQRAGTTFAQLDAGHSVHIDAPKEFVNLLRQFLKD